MDARVRSVLFEKVYESRLGRPWPPAAKATQAQTGEFDR
jgi:hypothetical protein